VLGVFFESIGGAEDTLVTEASKIFVKWLQKEGGAALISEICFDEAFGVQTGLGRTVALHCRAPSARRIR
jgi:hypothetical protein